jgi:hypothetical protein
MSIYSNNKNDLLVREYIESEFRCLHQVEILTEYNFLITTFQSGGSP